jgi:hypothetical protein
VEQASRRIVGEWVFCVEPEFRFICPRFPGFWRDARNNRRDACSTQKIQRDFGHWILETGLLFCGDMKVGKLLHTRYRVNDLERTVKFYRDILGL